MKYTKSLKYDKPIFNEKIMGPNPLKLTEELLEDNQIPAHALVCDLGSGQGVTSVFIAKEYGFKVYAADLWSDPAENAVFFQTLDLSEEQIVSVKADALNLPFAREFFDAVISTDSYNYFGREKYYLDSKLLPFVKKGGLFLAYKGEAAHDKLPAELLLSWTPEQLEYIHDVDYWRDIVAASRKPNANSRDQRNGV